MFKRRIVMILGLMSMITLGCTNEDENSQSNSERLNTQPIHYDARQENNERMGANEESIGEQGGYPQSEQRGVNSADYERGYSDSYTNEETELISSQLRKHKDIIQAQVASTDDRIIVAVMLRTNFKYNLRPNEEAIEEEVKQIVPDTDKEIVVYTDDIHWNRMKNMNSRYNTNENPEDLN